MGPAETSSRGAAAPADLRDLQRWFLGVVTHPHGVRHGADEPEARALSGGGGLERWIRPSRRLAAAERLGVYADAYFARLIECLREQFPALARAVGDETFAAFAFDYVRHHPSRSPSLNPLGARLPGHLADTRPPREGEGEGPDWADLVVELARFEWTVLEVFDGPGLEGRALLSGDALRAVLPAELPQLVLEPDPSLRLARFRFPLDDYYRRLRAAEPGEEVAPPAPGEELLLFHRRDYRVRRVVLEPAQHRLLEALVGGAPLGAALAAAFEGAGEDDAELGATLERWFGAWSAEGLFAGLAAPARRERGPRPARPPDAG